MKLINSKMEQEIREQLVFAHKWLFKSEKGYKIISFLKKIAGNIDSVYVLWSTPGQTEDFYGILVNQQIIMDFELPHSYPLNDIRNLKILDIKTYKRGLKGKHDNLQLMIALELSNNIH